MRVVVAVLVAHTGDFNEIQKALDDLKPGYGATNLVAALQRADRLLCDEKFKDRPQSSERIHYEDDLVRRYRTEIAKRHGITLADLQALSGCFLRIRVAP